MTDTVTTTDTDPQATRRAVFAFVALADAPDPVRVSFYTGELGIRLNTLDDARAWMRLLGITRELRSSGTYFLARGDWRGWSVLLSVETEEPQVSPPVDEATREQLTAIVQSGGAA